MNFIYEIPVLGPLIETLLTTVAPFLVMLSIVVFVHELGHYLVGRWCGIKAEAFSIGFGKELVGWTDRRGTRWRVALLPLGGYVKFKGDADAASATASEEVRAMSAEERRETLPGAPLWARTLTILAGPFANFILTIFLVFFLTLAQGVQTAEPVIGALHPEGRAAAAGIESGDKVLTIDGASVESFTAFRLAMQRTDDPTVTVTVEREGEELELTRTIDDPARVAAVVYGGPADLACVQAGDLITAVDGVEIETFEQFRRQVEASGGAALILTIDRGGETVTAVIEPKATDTLDPETGAPTQVYRVGIQAGVAVGAAPQMRSATIGDALSAGFGAPIQIADQTFSYIGAWISGAADGSQLSSLIGIADSSGKAASAGILSFISLIALISAAIGLMNLMPIPVLDGGHLLLYGVEAIRGKPLGERSLNVMTAIGLALVLFLMVFATSNDLTPLFNKLTSSAC